MKKLSGTRRLMMARTLAFVGAGALAAKAASASPTAAAGGPYRVVFQVSDADPKKWALTLNNVKNVQQELGARNITAEIVVYGPGIGMLKADSEVANRILETMQAGVAVVACENTMRGQHLTHDDMIGKIGFVPSGVAELVKRQAEGYAYIRA
jgi:intracellular sulfur oxidation DsrE/DsrF family protein